MPWIGEQDDCVYRSYLLRIWRFERRGGAGWRVSLEDTRSSARHGFTDLEALLAFLREQPRHPDDGPANQAQGAGR